MKRPRDIAEFIAFFDAVEACTSSGYADMAAVKAAMKRYRKAAAAACSISEARHED